MDIKFISMDGLFYVAAVIIGLVFGSFFNVCIYRLPRDEDLGARSRCPSCREIIRWYDNIPIVSFIILRGGCRHCGSRISLRYPIVEAGSAALFALVYYWSVNLVPLDLKISTPKITTPEIFIGLIVVSALIISTGVDLRHGIIPNEVTYTGFALLIPLTVGLALWRDQPGRILISFASGIGAGGFLLSAGLIYGALFMKKSAAKGKSTGAQSEEQDEEQGSKTRSHTDDLDESSTEELKTGIGMGDVKLMTMTGLALGYFHWYLVILALFMGYFMGAVVAIALIALKKKSRKDRIPFAPYLAIGSFVSLIWGYKIIEIYLNLLG